MSSVCVCVYIYIYIYTGKLEINLTRKIYEYEKSKGLQKMILFIELFTNINFFFFNALFLKKFWTVITSHKLETECHDKGLL